MANFGETLRRERELRDISLREIADATKVNLRYLEALEQNRFDILPGGVFNKGFIRAYARFIGADGESLVDRYLQEMAEREARAQAAAGSTAHAPGLHRPPEAPRRRSGPDPAPPAAAPTAIPASVAPASPTVDATTTRPMAVANPAAAAPSTPATHPTPLAEPMTAARPAPHASAQHAAPPQASIPHASVPHAPIFEAENAVAGSRSGTRIMTTSLWITGAILIAFLGVWVVRGLRSETPAAGGDGAPSSSVAEETVTGAAATGDTAPPPSPLLPAATPPFPIVAPAVGDVRPGAGAAPAPQEPEPSRRDDSIEHPVRPPGGPQQPAASPQPGTSSQAGAPRPARAPATVTTASAVPPPAPSVDSRQAAPAPATAGRGGMDFRIEATAPVWAQVACDGDERLNQALQPGQGFSMRCLSFVRLSVTDIAAVRLTVNGARCVAPGDRGARIEGFVIRAEDASAICPTQQGALLGSR